MRGAWSVSGLERWVSRSDFHPQGASFYQEAFQFWEMGRSRAPKLSPILWLRGQRQSSWDWTSIACSWAPGSSNFWLFFCGNTTCEQESLLYMGSEVDTLAETLKGFHYRPQPTALFPFQKSPTNKLQVIVQLPALLRRKCAPWPSWPGEIPLIAWHTSPV